MIYDRLYEEFISLFPDDNCLFQKLEEDAGVVKNEDGMHVLFGMVIVPFLRKAILESPEKVKKAFDFFEQMELDSDPEIGNVAEVSVFEALNNDEGGINKYLKYIGPESLKAARYMAQFYDVKPF